MTAPAFTRRMAQSIDDLMAGFGPPGWRGLNGKDSSPTIAPQPLQPGDAVAKFLFGMTQTPQGREVVEWMMDITFRAPFRATGRTIEETALLAATRQGIEGVGEAVLAAINHGADLVQREHERVRHEDASE